MGQGGEWIELKAGAFYGLLVDHHLSRDEAERIIAGWRECGPHDTQLIVLDGGMQIEELDDEKLRQLGLTRIEERG